MKKKRYAIVGAGDRGLGMFALPLMKDLSKSAELVAFVDDNPLRMEYSSKELPHPVACYTDFDEMLKQAKPDGVIIASRDSTHAEYVIRALKAGKRAFSEKPLCVSAKQCREILAAVKATRGKCLTTHNARYGPATSETWHILRSGKLGDIKFMYFEETLDRRHGADYFRRWHRHKANSGGLQIHKASHHFDLLNWFADSRPATLTAQGGLAFYGKNGSFRGRRCSDCKHTKKCEFYGSFEGRDRYIGLYKAPESADGYVRDGCVFDKSIDIEDQFSAQIRYENGIEASYNLVAYSPIETQRIVIEGTKGRLELSSCHNTMWALGSTTFPGIKDLVSQSLKLYIPNVGVKDVPLTVREGGHGGSDPQLRRDFFARDWKLAPNSQMADVHQAVQAVLVGAAINKSLATGGKSVDVQGLLKRD